MFSKIKPEVEHGEDKKGNYTITTWTDPETGEKRSEKNYIQKVDKKIKSEEKMSEFYKKHPRLKNLHNNGVRARKANMGLSTAGQMYLNSGNIHPILKEY